MNGCGEIPIFGEKLDSVTLKKSSVGVGVSKNVFRPHPYTLKKFSVRGGGSLKIFLVKRVGVSKNIFSEEGRVYTKIF